jgi:hypothetical protein
MSNSQRFTHILHKYQIFFYWSSIDRFAMFCCSISRISMLFSRRQELSCLHRMVLQPNSWQQLLWTAIGATLPLGRWLGYGWLWLAMVRSPSKVTWVADSDDFLNIYRLDHPKNFGHWHHLGVVLEWFVKGGFEKKRQDLTQRGDETWDISVRLYRNVSHGLHRMPLPA